MVVPTESGGRQQQDEAISEFGICKPRAVACLIRVNLLSEESNIRSFWQLCCAMYSVWDSYFKYLRFFISVDRKNASCLPMSIS